MKFTKAQSLGNDFLIIELEKGGGIPDINGFARKICHRHTGVGADGLITVSVEDSRTPLANFRIFNADGSEAEISGNGLRCAAAYFFAGGHLSDPKIVFRMVAGDRECEIIELEGRSARIRVGMGRPGLAAEDIPFVDGSRHEKIIDYPLSLGGRTYLVTLVSMGNPHCAVFVESFPSRSEWLEIGRDLQVHPFFPNRVNVEFVRVLDRREIEVRFFERGVGETMASGSGSAAAVVAAILKNLTDRTVSVRTPMGSVLVEWEKDDVFQSAPAELIFEGTLL